MNDDEHENGNGKVVSIHPTGDPTRALAEHTAHRVAQDERWIQRVDERIGDIHAGRTQWQIEVKRTLRSLTDEVHRLAMARIIWPALSVLAALFLGGVVGALLWFMTGHRLG